MKGKKIEPDRIRSYRLVKWRSVRIAEVRPILKNVSLLLGEVLAIICTAVHVLCVVMHASLHGNVVVPLPVPKLVATCP